MFTKLTKAVEDLSISFLPFIVLMTILFVFNQTSMPRADYPFLAATLFTDAAWRCKDLQTSRPTEKSCGILLGVFGALFSTIAAILLLLVELDKVSPEWVSQINTHVMEFTSWAFIVGVMYAIYIRYRIQGERWGSDCN